MFAVRRGMLAVLTLTLIGATGVAARPQQDVEVTPRAVCAPFAAQIQAYAAVHQRLEAPLPPMAVTKDMAALSAARRQLAASIKAERPDAKQGDVFTSEAAEYFRGAIALALGSRDVEAMLQELFGEQPALGNSHLNVYDPYPDWATHEVPVALLQHLPPLPEDVEYRVFDHDLVLWDSHANLVVDVLPNAFSTPAS